jgi:hypothetical protein
VIAYFILLILILYLIIKLSSLTPIENSRVWGPYPSKSPGLISYLTDNLQAQVNSPYRGRVATFLVLDESQPVGWLEIVGKYNETVKSLGNDFYWGGLWDRNVPTLFKYSPVMSPLYYLYMTRLLGKPNDRQTRNVVFLRSPKYNILAALGVKYIISDKELSTPFVNVYTESLVGNNNLFLFEIKNPNVGTYSPTEIIIKNSLNISIDFMLNNDIDYTRSIILTNRNGISNNLVPVLKSELKIVKGGYSLKAVSNGATLILLPIEFSECLKFINNTDNKLTIKQANIIQTAIYFEQKLDVDFSYTSGPFVNSMCRVKDLLSFKKFNQ